MPTTIKLKNSVTTTNVPSSLAQGEVAINVTDKKVWVGNAATTPVQLLGGGADGAFTNVSVSGVASFADGTVSLPSITNIGDTNTGIFFPAADTIAFTEGGTESMRIDSSGNLGIGTAIAGAITPSIRLGNSGSGGGVVTATLSLGSYSTGYGSNLISSSDFSTSSASYLAFGTTPSGASGLSAPVERMRIDSSGNVGIGTSSPSRKLSVYDTSNIPVRIETNTADTKIEILTTSGTQFIQGSANNLLFGTNNTERMRIDSSGNLLVSLNGTLYVGKTAEDGTQRGFLATSGSQNSYAFVTNDIASGGYTLGLNRQVSDGTLIEFRQANSAEGSVSVSGTTVSYNGGHLSRYAQTIGAKDDSLLKGTVLSNLDEMNVYVDVDGNTAENEQLNKVKVSDVEGDINVAGVFVNWYLDEAHNVDEINMAMTGDMIIRIAQGVTVNRGDLLMSAGDGTAKPQGDDIVRGKTIAKVTSTHVTCTYADGSYCVPCVLMAC